MADQLKNILQPLNTTGKPKTITVGQTYPHGVSRQYTADMRKIIKQMTKEINSEIMPLLKEDLSNKRNDSQRMDSLGAVLARINQMMQTVYPGDALAQSYANKTYAANEMNITKGIEKELGIKINLPGGDATLMNDWVTENTLYIQDLQEEYLRRIQKSVTNAYTKGVPYRQLAKDIQNSTGVTWRRAQVIARDQLGTLNAQVTKDRNEELGISKGRWRTLRDERVRGNPSGLYPKARPSHYARDMEIFDWDDGIDGEYPGTPIQCRCYAESVIELD